MLNLPPAQPITSQQPQPEHFLSPQPQPAVPAVTVAPTIVQAVSVEQAPARSDLLVDTAQWSWAEFRDYVVAEIIGHFGPFPRDARKEYGIFNRYFTTYGQDGIAVARYAFGPICEGWWGQAPISVNRFAKGSDPYFTIPILQRLTEA